MADSVAAITGCDPATAAGLLEAAGGNAELAISLFFDQGPPAPAVESPAGDGQGVASGAPARAEPRQPWELAVWPSAQIPEAWSIQVQPMYPRTRAPAHPRTHALTYVATAAFGGGRWAWRPVSFSALFL